MCVCEWVPAVLVPKGMSLRMCVVSSNMEREREKERLEIGFDDAWSKARRNFSLSLSLERGTLHGYVVPPGRL